GGLRRQPPRGCGPSPAPRPRALGSTRRTVGLRSSTGGARTTRRFAPPRLPRTKPSLAERVSRPTAPQPITARLSGYHPPVSLSRCRSPGQPAGQRCRQETGTLILGCSLTVKEAQARQPTQAGRFAEDALALGADRVVSQVEGSEVC